jgi:hypothetical protein
MFVDRESLSVSGSNSDGLITIMMIDECLEMRRADYEQILKQR